MTQDQTTKEEPIEQETVAQEPVSVAVEDNTSFYEGYSPLDEPVKQRSYTSANIDTSSSLDEELEEPVFKAPSFDEQSGSEAEDPEPNKFNPEIDKLDSKEQMYATEQMVDTVLDVYGKAHILANKVATLKEEKITKAVTDGEIDPSLQVPIDANGGAIGLMDYVQEYNSQLTDAISLDDDFVKKVRPPMLRVFQKKGLALTDEQYLAVAFGGDIITKGAMLFQLVRQNNKLIDMWKEQSVSRNVKQNVNVRNDNPVNSSSATNSSANENAKAQPPQEPMQEPTQKVETVYNEPSESDFTANSMVEDMLGSNTVSDKGIPVFGDPEILSEMSKLSEEDTKDATPPKKRKRGRPKKKK